MINANSKMISLNDQKYEDKCLNQQKDIDHLKSLDMTKIQKKLNQAIVEVSNLKDASIKLQELEKDINLKFMQIDRSLIQNHEFSENLLNVIDN